MSVLDVSLYVCIHSRACTHIHTHAHTHAHIYIYTIYLRLCSNTHMQRRGDAGTHPHTHILVHINNHEATRTQAYDKLVAKINPKKTHEKFLTKSYDVEKQYKINI